MNTHLKITIKDQGEERLVSLSGRIDEDSEFTDLTKLQCKMISFNFNDVTLINSCGIREWIHVIEKLAPKTKIIYQHCPQVIIEQINMVKGFVPTGAMIDSFYAPYFCEECDKEKSMLLRTADVVNFKAPARQCPVCSKSMEFDALEQQYFHFLKQK